MVVPPPASHDDGAALAHRGAQRLHELEQRWSRFLPTSEITGLNRADGRPCTVHTDTVRLVETLVGAWQLTGGAFDPTLLGVLVDLGYAASRDDATTRTSLAHGTMPAGRPDHVEIDRSRRTVRLPRGTTLDPGGLGKGLAADLIVEDLLEAGALGALVEVGGDIKMGGEPPDGAAWLIAVAPVFPDDAERLLRIRQGAAATSSSRLRTWRQRGTLRHHVLDPATLRPTASETAAATVLTGSAAWAEALAKVAFVNGPDEGLAAYERHGVAASIATEDGTRHDSSRWQEFLA